jgi:hypothetical protein
MKSIFVIVLLLATLVSSASAEEETCDMLFVQNAKAMSFDGSRLTLKEANPNIIFFCDRPVRTAGHMTRDAFMKLVTEGENSFAVNPPNAAVSIVNAKGDVTTLNAIAEKIKDQSDSCVPLSKQIIQLAEDFNLDGIQKLADALDAS